jgi:RNA polymerase sigma factor (sigma-70 family)
MTAFLDQVLRGAEALAARDPVGTLPDAELLRRFTAGRDQTAFAVLVRRHGPLVWGVCRNLLPRDADAEDAFQATFLALVRSAATVRRAEALGGWLHGVAYRVAMRARRTAARRKRRETIAAVGEADAPVADAAWDELQAAVHEEVCRLPDKLRLPFVLCTLQGRAQRDAADQLGWKIGTLSGRLTLARQRLLDRLARRGVPSAALALGAVAGAASVPSHLCGLTFQTAMAPDRASPVVLSLARGVTFMARTKMIVAGVLIAGALTTGLGTRFLSTADAQAPPTDPNADDIRKALDFLLQKQMQASSRFEYKFVPIEKALSVGDLQKVLTQHDREGWDYCGTQDLLSSDKLKGAARAEGTPYMVFKRQRAAAAGPDASRAALAEALRAVGDKPQDDVRRSALEAWLKAYRAGEAKPAADAKTADLERKYLEEMLQKYEKLRSAEDGARKAAEAERVRVLEAEAAARAQAELQDAAKKRAVEADQLKRREAELKLNGAQWRAEAEEQRVAVRALEAELQKTRALAEQLAKRLAELDAEKKKAASVKPVADEQRDSLSISLKHVNAGDVSKIIQQVFPKTTAKIVVDERTNTLHVTGPAETLADIKKVIGELDKPAEKK